MSDKPILGCLCCGDWEEYGRRKGYESALKEVRVGVQNLRGDKTAVRHEVFDVIDSLLQRKEEGR